MYVRIIDQGECLSTTREYVDGVYANKNEWAKHNFYPKNGMVGELVKRTPSAYIVKIMDGIYVPMTRNGIEEISSKDYEAGVKNNLCCGMDERQKKINEGLVTFYEQTGNDWFHLSDMREAFKQDIVRNIENYLVISNMIFSSLIWKSLQQCMLSICVWNIGGNLGLLWLLL